LDITASFLVVNLDDSGAARPFGVARLVAGDVQNEPPRDASRMLTVEIWEPIDHLDLFGSYRAAVPEETTTVPQGAVLYFGVHLTAQRRLPSEFITWQASSRRERIAPTCIVCINE